MFSIRKKLDELDVTWKIAFRKTLLVFGCFIGWLCVYIIVMFGLTLPLSLLPQEVLFTQIVYYFVSFGSYFLLFFGFFVGLFKALIDISILTKTELLP
ncbi:MAG: hypothetical protein ACFFB2_05040 [Promethearchaeota archaeon]